MPWPFVSRSVQYRVHYVRTLASLVASNISSDAAAEIALIMLIKLLRLSTSDAQRPSATRFSITWLQSVRKMKERLLSAREVIRQVELRDVNKNT